MAWRLKNRLSRPQRLGLGAAALIGIGAAGGAGAMALTRPPVEMAPTVATPIARLAARDGIVTVKGRVAAVYGDRFLVQDGTGRALVAAPRGSLPTLDTGSTVMVQGRFDDGQLRARFMVDQAGNVSEVAPPPDHGDGRRPHGPRPGEGPPPPPPGAPGTPPPPPPPGAPGADAPMPPPPPAGPATATQAPPAAAPVPAPVAPRR